MDARLDHVVLWVEDPLRTLAFFADVVGFPALRVDEFREGKVMFPSVRVSPSTILDLMPRSFAPMLNGMGAGTPAASAAGNLVNHVCFAMSSADFDALDARLQAAGVSTAHRMADSFGAQGSAPRAFYFQDPDGNVFEARHYD